VKSTDVVIIGAGAAGLMAARELRKAGRTCVVLEASDRVGGRVKTVYDTRAGLPIELGAEFVHGDAPETTRLLDEAHLVTVPVNGKQFRSDKGELTPQGPLWDRMSRVFSHLGKHRKKDRSFQDFLDEKPGGRKLRDERELARGFVQGFEAADTALISARSLADQGDPTEGASEARRIINGYAALIDYLHKDVTGNVMLNTRAMRVGLDGSRMRVFDNQDNEYDADAVIVTIALSMLRNDSIAFELDVADMRHASQQLVMGHAMRLNVIVRERFWEKKADRLSYLHTPTRPFNVWWTQSPLEAPLLVAWSGGPPARKLSEAGDVENVAIGELARVFGFRRSRADKLVDSIHWHDWTRDPLTLGAYGYAAVGGANAARQLARHVDDKLFFAGEATDSGSGGTVEGALASGKRVARRILSQSAQSR
jgi:monoamine oxidase